MNYTEILTLIFWLSSTIFASISLIILIKEYNRNKFNVVLYTSKMTEVNSKDEYIILKITNTWRRDVYISSISYKWTEKNKYWLITEDINDIKLPIKLSEWESYTKTYNYNKLITSLGDNKLVWFHVEDSLWWKHLIKFNKESFSEIT